MQTLSETIERATTWWCAADHENVTWQRPRPQAGDLRLCPDCRSFVTGTDKVRVERAVCGIPLGRVRSTLGACR